MHKEFVGLYFRWSTETFIPRVVVLSCFISVNSKQPRNPRKFTPLKIKYPYSIQKLFYKEQGKQVDVFIYIIHSINLSLWLQHQSLEVSDSFLS